MPRIVYITTPNTEEPLLYADVYKQDAENREDIPDTITANHALPAGEQVEVLLEDDEYLILHLDSVIMTNDPQFGADPQYVASDTASGG